MCARVVCRDITRLRCHEAELAEARNRERLFSYIVNLVRRELDHTRMLATTAEALLPALALSGLSIHAIAGRTLAHPLVDDGITAHVAPLADLVTRTERGRDSRAARAA